MKDFKNVQIGYFVNIVLLMIIAILPLSYIYKWGNNPMPLPVTIIAIIIFFIALLFFYKLKIVVNDDGIKIIFGIGLIRINIKPDKVYSIRVTKVPWYYGLGIRYTTLGKLYNIQGTEVVEIKYLISKKEKTVLLGSNKCEDLKNVLEKKYLSDK